MQTSPLIDTSLEQLKYLPSFAGYILSHRLKPFVEQLIYWSRAFNLPLLNQVNHLSEEEMVERGMKSNVDFLEKLAGNRADEFIKFSLQKLVDNQISLIDRTDIKAEDLALIGYVRKRAFLKFIPEFTSDSEQIVELIRELDLFFMTFEVETTNVYLELLKESTQEKSHLIENINNTIPGAIYVFDFEKRTNIYSNGKLQSMLGYSNTVMDAGIDALTRLLHPDDKQPYLDFLDSCRNAEDGEIKTFKFRAKHSNGQYGWLYSHESVFKRNRKREVIQIIGIILDIDKEQQIEEALLENERLHQQAETLTHLGSYTLDLKTRELHMSDEMYRIHGLDATEGKISLERLLQDVLPDDLSQVREAVQKAIAENTGIDFYYRISQQNGNYKILHARGNIIRDKDNAPSSLLGTVQDVTEKQMLIRNLRHSQSLYKQAEELVNMGNWTYDVRKKKLEWTDQLYRIYGLEPQSEEMTIQRFLSFIHPADQEMASKAFDDILEKNRLDFTFRIITADGKNKILRTVAQVQMDIADNPLMIVGTERDVTEKTNLIDQLKYSESLYKQAQALAHVGNWTLHIKTGQFSWSDELFRIFGLPPQSQVISYQDFFNFIHPEDLNNLKDKLEESIDSKQPWELSFKIIRRNGDVRIVFATGEVFHAKKDVPVSMIGTMQDVTERQSLIDKLQESEQLYKQAQSLVHLGNWSIDINTRSFSWSDEMYRIYEMEPGGPLNFDDWLHYHLPEEAKEIEAYYNHCIFYKHNYDRIHRVKLKNGKIKTIHRKGELVYDVDGNPVKMIGTTQDITEEYRVQQELKENQTFIRKITDATPSIISSYNVNTGKYVFINEGLTKLLGYDISQVMNEGISFMAEKIHPEDLPGLIEKNNKTLEEANQNTSKNDLVAEFTYRLRHKNGQYRWFHTYGTVFDRDASNKVEHMLNISLDVTEQVEASRTIKEQEHFIQHIADASPTILYLYDVPSQRIVYINREIFFVLGYLPEEILDARDRITELIYHPEDYHLLPGRQQSGKTFQQVDSMIQYECRMKNKDGQWRWLLVREIVFKTDEQGNIIQILGAALDINHRKEMEKTILQNTLLLEQSNASLEEFAYVASHDLKEPLRKISTFGDRLVATHLDKLAPDGRLYLQKIVDASQRMQVMISDLLSISMITGNKSFETFSLQKILNETLQTLEYKIEQQNALIKSDELPEAKIIPSQFRQLFQNLLSNSLKFVKPGVQPVITIKHSWLTANEVGNYQVSKATNYHRIEISDNGIGFEPEFAGKIFAIFQRLHGRSEYEGSGIGLAICKKIVEHHGGVIYATGVPDVGATFTIILPA